MTTDLYGARVLTVVADQQRARIEVFVVRYDWVSLSHPPLPDDPGYFLRLLWETAPDDAPIRDVISPEQARDADWIDSHVGQFVTRAERVSPHHKVLEERDYDLLSFYYYERDGRWADEFRLVQGEYDIEVSDPRWLRHLRTGLTWGSESQQAETEHVTPDDAPCLPDLSWPAAVLRPFYPSEDDCPDGEMPDGFEPAGLLFSDDSRYLAVLTEDGDLAVYGTDDWTERVRVGRWERQAPYDKAYSILMWVPGRPVIVLSDAFADEPAPQWAYDVVADEEVETAVEAGFTRSHTGRHRVEFGWDGSVEFVTAPGVPDRRVHVGPPEGPESMATDAVAFDATDEPKMFVNRGPNVYVVDPDTGDHLGTVLSGGRRLAAVASSPDGAYVVTSEENVPGEQPCVWRVADGVLMQRCRIGLNVGPLAWSPDGRWLAAGVHGYYPGGDIETFVFRIGVSSGD